MILLLLIPLLLSCTKEGDELRYSTMCIEGVRYYEFEGVSSGVVLALDSDSKVIKCNAIGPDKVRSRHLNIIDY